MTEVVKAAKPSKPRRMSAGELARKIRTVGGKLITTAPPVRRGVGGGWPDRSPWGRGGNSGHSGPVPVGLEAGRLDDQRWAPEVGDGDGPAGRRAYRPGSRKGLGTCGQRVSDEEGVRVGADRANRGRSGWRCGGVGRTRRGLVPSGGNPRGLPTSRSRGTTEPWWGLRGFRNGPHIDEPPPSFKDAVHRTDTYQCHFTHPKAQILLFASLVISRTCSRCAVKLCPTRFSWLNCPRMVFPFGIHFG